jgi:hypothetical protein
MLSLVTPSVIKPNDIMPAIIIPRVFILNVILLIVTSPCQLAGKAYVTQQWLPEAKIQLVSKRNFLG